MDRKEYDNNVEKIKDITKCTDEIARKALSQATNLNDAIYIARNLMTKESYVGGGSSGLAVENAKKIVEYADGILVEDTFYSYKDEKNLRLKSMLERKEFDAGLLGGNDNDNVSVMYVDRKNENYEKEEKKEQKKIVYPQVGESLNLPETMIIEEGDIKFKILTCDKRINVTMKSGIVKDVIKYIESQCKKKIILKSGNKILDENADVQTINRSMVVLEIKK